MEDLRGRGLAGYMQGGALAAGALLQGLLRGEAGDFRVIIRFAQVGKHQHLGGAIKVFGKESRRRQVGEVPMAAHHPLLNVPRVGPDFEHVQIVIRLEDEALAAFHSLLNNFMHITQVGDHANLNAV